MQLLASLTSMTRFFTMITPGFFRVSFPPFEAFENRMLLAINADDSISGVSRVSFPNITFLLLPFLWIFENTSRVDGKTSRPRILP